MHVISFMLNAMDNIKLYHWMTQSYPRHIATDKLYEKLSENVDKFVEVYIGKYGRPGCLTRKGKDMVIELKPLTDANATAFLDSLIAFFMRDVFKYIEQNDVDLLTIRDEIVSDLNQTKYLFTLKN